VEAIKVNGSTAGRVAVINYITAGRAQGVGLTIGKSSKIPVNCGQSSNN
jgi:hypothetical protein